jgi:hypothetical protein
MRTTIAALLLGSVLTLPVAAKAQNFQQLLGGLLTGNQQEDQALRDAWRRGYQAGRDDQAREDRRGGDRYDRRSDYRDNRDYRDDRPYGPPPGYPPPR